jgi:TonB family protein
MLRIFFYLIIFILFRVEVFSQATYSNGRISYDYSKTPLRNVLKDIEEKADVEFIYNDKLVDNVFVSFKLDNEEIEKAIGKLLRRFDISYKMFGEKIFVLFREVKQVPKPPKLEPVVIRMDIPEADSLLVVQKPVLITNVKLLYPEGALSKNIEGKVVIRFLIQKDGSVSRIHITSSSDNSILDSASMEYVRNLKFLPAEANGKPHNSWMSMRFEFYCEAQKIN